MSETEDLFDDMRDKLRAAYKAAEGNHAAQEKILQDLSDLADVQGRTELGALTKKAAILNELSNILDSAIAAVRNNIDNFLLNDIIALKNSIDKKLGKPAVAAPPLAAPGPVVVAAVAPAVAQPAPAATGKLICALSSSGQRHVNGPVVIALQTALLRGGQATEPDGDFGSLTVGALNRWQAANSFAQAPGIDAAQWTKLSGLAAPSLFDLCLNVTADFEGTSFDRVVGNFDGAGITFGLIGFTLKNGEIKKLLTAIEGSQPGLVATAFGAAYPELMSILDAPVEERLAWADSISLGTKKYEVGQPWKDAFKRLGGFAAARKAQIDRAYLVYWNVAKKYLEDFMAGKPVTDLDAALWYDTAVQNSISDEDRQAILAAAASNATGRDLRAKFAEAIAEGSAKKWRADVLARKSTFIDGTGTVHGSAYGLASWGFDGSAISDADLAAPSSIVDLVSKAATGAQPLRLEPDDEAGEANSIGGPELVAVPLVGNSVNSSWPLYSQFVAFVANLGLRNFTPDELLFLGGQNSAGNCAGLNSYPPQELWSNIAPTAAVLDKLRADMAAPIHLLSVYRAPPYNKCIDGAATNSFHMRFQAIDFVCDKGTPGDWAAKLDEYRTRGIFKGGLGVYRSFVHVDTRGINANWTR